MLIVSSDLCFTINTDVASWGVCVFLSFRLFCKHRDCVYISEPRPFLLSSHTCVGRPCALWSLLCVRRFYCLSSFQLLGHEDISSIFRGFRDKTVDEVRGLHSIHWLVCYWVPNTNVSSACRWSPCYWVSRCLSHLPFQSLGHSGCCVKFLTSDVLSMFTSAEQGRAMCWDNVPFQTGWSEPQRFHPGPSSPGFRTPHGGWFSGVGAVF